MLVTITFDITTKDQKEIVYSDFYLYVDIEVTDEEFSAIGESCDTGLFRGMYEDKSLSEICDRCRDAISDWHFEETYGDDLLFRFDYPLETRIDRAETLWQAGYDEIAKDELIPTDSELHKNNDGTYNIWWPGKQE